jgi:hypothetical protein
MISPPGCRRSSPEEVAYHEAGHVVVGHVLGLDLVDVDVVADREGGNGHTNFRAPGWFPPAGPLAADQRSFVESVVTTFLAGTAAEARHAGFENPEASGFDYDAVAREWARYLGPDSAIDDRLAALRVSAERLLADPDNWSAIERLARVLLKRRRIDAREALSSAGLTSA